MIARTSVYGEEMRGQPRISLIYPVGRRTTVLLCFDNMMEKALTRNELFRLGII